MMDSQHVTTGTLSTNASSTPIEGESGSEPIVPPPSSSTLPPSSKRPEKKRDRTTSLIWDHYTKKVDSNGKVETATCNYCGKEYNCPSRNGTSTITSHLNKCSKYPHSQVNTISKKQKSLEFSAKGSEGESQLLIWKFDQTLSRQALTELIIGAELPFKFVEHPKFINFCNVVQPKLKLVKRTTTTRDCLEMYNEEKAKLRRILTKTSQRVCLTTDTWTSLQNISYMSLTAHYIDDGWKLHKKIINFCEIDGHTAEDIGRAIEMCLLHWKIEKVFAITVDNAISNDHAIGYLKRKINHWGSSILDSKYLHVRCCGHILNLIVSDGLKEVKESISRIRAAVKQVRSSPSRKKKFKHCIELEKIPFKASVSLDVSTRWNSTYLMLDSAVKYQRAFERLYETYDKISSELKNGIPTKEDWNVARALLQFLDLFYWATLRLSASQNVTSNAYFHEVHAVETLIHECLGSDDSYMRSMAMKMKMKFDKYWGDISKVNMILLVAVVLDPRYKLKFLKYCYGTLYPNDQVVEMIRKVKEVVNDLYVEYELFSDSSISRWFNETRSFSRTSEESEDSLFGNVRAKKAVAGFQKFLEEEASSSNKSEVDIYLDEGCEKQDDFDILSWWKNNASKYKILSMVARDVLAIPVSTVASESAFSAGGRVLDKFRTSLTPKIVEALICTHDWICGPTKMEVEEELGDLEELESGILDTLVIDD